MTFLNIKPNNYFHLVHAFSVIFFGFASTSVLASLIWFWLWPHALTASLTFLSNNRTIMWEGNRGSDDVAPTDL